MNVSCLLVYANSIVRISGEILMANIYMYCYKMSISQFVTAIQLRVHINLREISIIYDAHLPLVMINFCHASCMDHLTFYIVLLPASSWIITM